MNKHWWKWGLLGAGAVAAGGGAYLVARNLKPPIGGPLPIKTPTQTSGAKLAVPQQRMPTPVVGQAYAYAFQATGAEGSVAWSAKGDVPAGLALTSAGVLQGTPTKSGLFVFTVTATDAAGQKASRSTPLTVAKAKTTGTSGTSGSSGATAAEIASLQQQINQAQAQLSSLQKQDASLEAEYTSLHRQNVASRATIRSLQATLGSAA